MEQDDLAIALKQKKMKNGFTEKKIPDDYHTLDRAGQVTLICLHTGHNTLNSHSRTHTENMSIIPTSHRTDMVRRSIRSCMVRKNN